MSNQYLAMMDLLNRAAAMNVKRVQEIRIVSIAITISTRLKPKHAKSVQVAVVEEGQQLLSVLKLMQCVLSVIPRSVVKVVLFLQLALAVHLENIWKIFHKQVMKFKVAAQIV
jgi:hypothetical protein